MPTDDHDDVLLIDIAASLSSPPFLPRKPAAAPVTAPFVVSEPRSGVPFDQGLVDRYEARKQWIHSRLALLQSTFKARFPLKPSFPDEDLKSRPSDDDGAPDLLAYQANLGAAWTINSLRDTEISVDLTAAALQELSLVDIYGIVHYNPLPFWLTLKLNISKPYEYMIPPRSSFLLGPFTSTIPVFTAFAGATAPPGLDFILLDPPWPNRSAHRARHQHAYKTSTFDAYDLFKLGVPRLLRQDAAGLVGIWVTNSSKWRAFVLDKLFAAWKLRPVAEWLWVKITVDGEPIFNLDNIARKPYESLILARPIAAAAAVAPAATAALAIAQPVDRVIFAMPDVHSRKPCLKGLVEPYLASEPRCAEIFARNLTEGWLSWGNEVLKGNLRDCWA